MKKVAVKTVSVMLSAALCIPVCAFSAGNYNRKGTAPGQATATAEPYALPAQAQAAEFEFMDTLPETVTTALETVQADKAESPAANSPAEQYEMPDTDKDTVTLLEFGSEFLAAYLTGLNNLTSGLAVTGGDLASS